MPGIPEIQGKQTKFTQGKGESMACGCLVLLGADGLLLAGRNISGKHLAYSSFRIVPISVNSGQAAGMDAVLCVTNGLEPAELNKMVKMNGRGSLGGCKVFQ